MDTVMIGMYLRLSNEDSNKGRLPAVQSVRERVSSTSAYHRKLKESIC